jgi:hypothetical protein
MDNQGIDLFEASFVQEKGEALSRCELAASVLGFDTFLAAAQRGLFLQLA